jgi:NAD+ kinase
LTDINCVGVLAHPLRPQSFPIAHQIKDRLLARGVDTWVYTDWHEADVREAVQRAQLVFAIGGDGAMLRAARVCAPFAVPVLGINMGQLGFLTEIADPAHWEDQFESVLAGEYWIEQRSMIHARVAQNGAVVTEGTALNDIVISGNIVGRMIHVETFIDDDWATTYHADALVIATATGSTAYALACGGPILPPELSNILIVPAAPHLSMDRPIVLAEGARVEVVATATGSGGVVLSADGVTLRNLQPGDRVRVHVSDHTSRFIRLRVRNYFYRSLLDRLEPRVQRPRMEEPDQR